VLWIVSDRTLFGKETTFLNEEPDTGSIPLAVIVPFDLSIEMLTFSGFSEPSQMSSKF